MKPEELETFLGRLQPPQLGNEAGEETLQRARALLDGEASVSPARQEKRNPEILFLNRF